MVKYFKSEALIIHILDNESNYQISKSIIKHYSSQYHDDHLIYLILDRNKSGSRINIYVSNHKTSPNVGVSSSWASQ